MQKKNTLKSRKNKRQFSLKKATRKRGGGILSNVGSVFRRKKIYQNTKPKPDDVTPPVVHNLKTFNDLQTLYNGNIPLDIFTIDMAKVQEYKRQEENSPATGREEMHEAPGIEEMPEAPGREEMHETDDAADHSATWEPTRLPPPLPPRPNKEEPATD